MRQTERATATAIITRRKSMVRAQPHTYNSPLHTIYTLALPRISLPQRPAFTSLAHWRHRCLHTPYPASVARDKRLMVPLLLVVPRRIQPRIGQRTRCLPVLDNSVHTAVLALRVCKRRRGWRRGVRIPWRVHAGSVCEPLVPALKNWRVREPRGAAVHRALDGE